MFVCHRYESLIPLQGATRGLRLVYFLGAHGHLHDGGNRPRLQYLPRYRDWPHDAMGGRGRHRVAAIYFLGSHHHIARHLGLHSPHA